MAETANKGQQVPQGHKVLLVLLVLLVHKAFPAKMVCLDRRETSVHRAFLALLDETAEMANKVLLVHKARRVPKAKKAKKATLEAAYQPLTSCLCT
jgi:hypothetical protein